MHKYGNYWNARFARLDRDVNLNYWMNALRSSIYLARKQLGMSDERMWSYTFAPVQCDDMTRSIMERNDPRGENMIPLQIIMGDILASIYNLHIPDMALWCMIPLGMHIPRYVSWYSSV